MRLGLFKLTATFKTAKFPKQHLCEIKDYMCTEKTRLNFKETPYVMKNSVKGTTAAVVADVAV